MTQQVSQDMMNNRNVIHYEIASLAAGNTYYFRPLLSAPSNMRITGFRHVCATFESGDNPTVSLQVGSPDLWTTVSLTGGNDSPAMLATFEDETTDSDGTTFSSSTSDYVATNESLQIVIDYEAAATDPATGLVIEIYLETL